MQLLFGVSAKPLPRCCATEAKQPIPPHHRKIHSLFLRRHTLACRAEAPSNKRVKTANLQAACNVPAVGTTTSNVKVNRAPHSMDAYPQNKLQLESCGLPTRRITQSLFGMQDSAASLGGGERETSGSHPSSMAGLSSQLALNELANQQAALLQTVLNQGMVIATLQQQLAALAGNMAIGTAKATACPDLSGSCFEFLDNVSFDWEALSPCD